MEYYQPAVQVNYPNDHEFTRIVETKHVTGQKLPLTTIVREYPQDFGPGNEPYDPIPATDAKAIYQKYPDLASKQEKVSFIASSDDWLPIAITIWIRSSAWRWPSSIG
jgi:UDP-galactopyranose mutase